jgi:hypothetical protein
MPAKTRKPAQMTKPAPTQSTNKPANLQKMGNAAAATEAKKSPPKDEKSQLFDFPATQINAGEKQTPIMDERQAEADRIDDLMEDGKTPEWAVQAICEDSGFEFSEGMCTDPLQAHALEAEACLEQNKSPGIAADLLFCNEPGSLDRKPKGRTQPPGGNYCDADWIKANPTAAGNKGTCDAIGQIGKSTAWVEPAAMTMLRVSSLAGGLPGMIIDGGMALHGIAENDDYSGLATMAIGKGLGMAGGSMMENAGDAMGHMGGLGTKEVGEMGARALTKTAKFGIDSTKD